MSKLLQIVIPVREGGNAYTTLRSLGRSRFQDFDVVVVQDRWGNANAARNAGAAGDSEFLLFSDDDIEWEPRAIGHLIHSLKVTGQAVAYGQYEMGGKVYCDSPFSLQKLRRHNFISTMSLIRRSVFPGWDQMLQRLQDWDVWLRISQVHPDGFVYLPEIIFRTAVRDGITKNGKISYQDAERIVKEKHSL
jgi:hypothetical protein